jgi:hypothetical protein
VANRFGNEDGIDYDGKLLLISPGFKRERKSIRKEGYISGVIKCW